MSDVRQNGERADRKTVGQGGTAAGSLGAPADDGARLDEADDECKEGEKEQNGHEIVHCVISPGVLRRDSYSAGRRNMI